MIDLFAGDPFLLLITDDDLGKRCQLLGQELQQVICLYHQAAIGGDAHRYVLSFLHFYNNDITDMMLAHQLGNLRYRADPGGDNRFTITD